MDPLIEIDPRIEIGKKKRSQEIEIEPLEDQHDHAAPHVRYSSVAQSLVLLGSDADVALPVSPARLPCTLPNSSRILGRRTAPFSPFLIPHRAPHGVTPRS